MCAAIDFPINGGQALYQNVVDDDDDDDDDGPPPDLPGKPEGGVLEAQVNTNNISYQSAGGNGAGGGDSDESTEVEL